MLLEPALRHSAAHATRYDATRLVCVDDLRTLVRR